ncbi:MAG: tetraacyldisaccharide 4'-kinase [Deltaproteobacteria bacterium RIFOXYB12_FULL_58_9]|nr:MAG: tetraacyldisaccharide 4'-kinase [Deltaproteobacteria bacterium RIFOXYB12_FULL_58_9]
MTWGPLFAPLAGLYGAGVVLRRTAYDRGWFESHAAPLFLVSVGGLEAGGSGKTPVTGLLLQAFQRAGRRVGLLTRGYGRQSSGLVVRQMGAAYDAATIGDEPAMLVRSGLDVPVAVCSNRNVGAHALCELGCDVGVLDDAFAHRAQQREVDIVVLRGDAPVGNGHLLPWGSLREPISSLRRANVIWLHFRGTRAGPIPDWLTQRFPAAVFVVSHAVVGPVNFGEEEVNVAGKRVLAMAGIARPADVVASLEGLGAQVIGLKSFSDHHRYSQTDISRVIDAARAEKVDGVVTTAKDAVKLTSSWEGPPLWVLQSTVAIIDGQDALAQLIGIKGQFLGL